MSNRSASVELTAFQNRILYLTEIHVFSAALDDCRGDDGEMWDEDAEAFLSLEEDQILDHLKHKAEASAPKALPESRAPPVGLQSGLFD